MSRPLVDEANAKTILGDTLSHWYRAETMKSKFGDGQQCTYVFDESGNGNNMSTASAAASPLMVSDGINGYGSFIFDGSNDRFLCDVAYGSVIKGEFAIIKQTASGNWTGAASIAFLGSQTAGGAGINGTNGSQDIASAGTEIAYVNEDTTATVTNTDAWNFVMVTTASAGSFASGSVIGSLNSGGTIFTGEIAECGAFTTVPTAAQRAALIASVIAKYAITGNVGSPA